MTVLIVKVNATVIILMITLQIINTLDLHNNRKKLNFGFNTNISVRVLV